MGDAVGLEVLPVGAMETGVAVELLARAVSSPSKRIVTLPSLPSPAVELTGEGVDVALSPLSLHPVNMKHE